MYVSYISDEVRLHMELSAGMYPMAHGPSPLHAHAPALQYRMHPSLSAFPAAAFYGGRLLDGVDAADRAPVALPMPGAHPIVFVDVSHVSAPCRSPLRMKGSP